MNTNSNINIKSKSKDKDKQDRNINGTANKEIYNILGNYGMEVVKLKLNINKFWRNIFKLSLQLKNMILTVEEIRLA